MSKIPKIETGVTAKSCLITTNPAIHMPVKDPEINDGENFCVVI
jgi:hypothetical protein